MTGTSLDGLDVVLARVEGRGLGMQAHLLDHLAMPLPADLKAVLASLAAGTPHTPIATLRAARYLGVLHAQACGTLMGRHPDTPLDAVIAHGQTICHAPGDGLSWQLFDPWPLVRSLNVTVGYDLRQADLIAGGQGAPVTPLADWVCLRHSADAVINLGGIVNITRLATTPAAVRGADVGPANLLLDGLCTAWFNEPFDDHGQRALAGTATEPCVATLRAAVDERLVDSTLGREQFSTSWVQQLAAQLAADHLPENALAAASVVVAQIAAGHPMLQGATRWLLAGGGVRNAALVAAFEQAAAHAKANVRTSDAVGLAPEAREALAFAVLGALSQDGVSATLSQVTGADSPGVAGIWAFPPVVKPV